MFEKNNEGKLTAILGWSLPAIEAIDKLDRPYVVVGPPDFEGFAKENDINFVGWDFDRLNEGSEELFQILEGMNTKLAVPIYEETVEWAGALNARFFDDPRVFNRSLLLRDKGLMKRKAQMSGIKVGVFEEAYSKDDIHRFLKRVNDALIKIEGDLNDPIHIKPLNKAGTVGHMVIRDAADIEKIEEEFPYLMESHLDGQEFSCEAFIHDGQVKFLNITEYVKLGHSNFIPASPKLEAYRPQILNEIQKLVESFEIKYGVIHPEYFISHDGTLNFGEVAARVPGGHIFDLIERAYGFNAFQAQILCSDPDTTPEELEAFFPEEVTSAKGYAGSLMVYPRVRLIEKLNVPEELKNDPYFEKHDLFIPVTSKVAERVGFGNHYGTLFFFGEDSDRMTELLKQYEKFDFYL
ncbi:carboxylate--amine ligase [Planococcus glaciei]|uniref:ATP-grasp domain-containing protein n=1 Tax=Planococcus liqunii TaxID=3058394 RepID=A0ABT8MLH9_9BACL|nr:MULTISPECIES: ATP-grasp domain-containing protein [Planococcus]KOF11321.1 carboxylate--amine ligase [Planococcus glaciei]MBX0313971.1 ATP-grasp domain-containing protein [Planococcus glaciei]MDN7225742.1 ATP-grasp domain-containing protein [Planococcus sp. N064]WKA49538.1 ATP-grasp domain-containing protein [Planococcus sp. N056]